jgi:hypothetical protein
MGQIIIDIPTRANRRYIITDRARSAELLTHLEDSAVRVADGLPSGDESDYLEDVRDIERAMAEYERTGKTYKWQDIKIELGL